jgi:hypothetical protein
VTRLGRSLWPFHAHSFFETIGETPDLYGPFWVCATLVFAIGVTSNLASWVATPDGSESDWHYDFSLMTQAASVVVGFAVVVPVALWLTLRHFAVPLRFSRLACLYGYSITAYLPAAVRAFAYSARCITDVSAFAVAGGCLGVLLIQVLCTTPSAALDWLAVSIAMALSSCQLLVNVYPALNEHAPASSKVLALFTAGESAVLQTVHHIECVPSLALAH